MTLLRMAALIPTAWARAGAADPRARAAVQRMRSGLRIVIAFRSEFPHQPQFGARAMVGLEVRYAAARRAAEADLAQSIGARAFHEQAGVADRDAVSSAGEAAHVLAVGKER